MLVRACMNRGLVLPPPRKWIFPQPQLIRLFKLCLFFKKFSFDPSFTSAIDYPDHFLVTQRCYHIFATALEAQDHYSRLNLSGDPLELVDPDVLSSNNTKIIKKRNT